MHLCGESGVEFRGTAANIKTSLVTLVDPSPGPGGLVKGKLIT